MYTTIYSFEGSELRVLRSVCVDDEEFMNRVADIIGNLTQQRDAEKLRADMAEHTIRLLENS